MKEIIIKTQAEYDALPADVSAYIYIEGGTKDSPLGIYRNFPNGHQYVRGNATIQDVYDNATIQYVRDNATIQYVRGNATIQDVRGNATIQYVRDNATIQYVRDNATIQAVYGLASILMVFGCAAIATFGHNIVRAAEKGLNIKASKDTTYIIVPKEVREPRSFDIFKQLYPVEVKRTKTIMYKSVHKRAGKYVADYDKKTEYVIGKNITGEIDHQTEDSCSIGLHVSYKKWAVAFGSSWSDMALLECEVPISKIVVAADTDGKVRTSELKVLREVPREEW